jgi:hypothetical protein
LLWFFFKSKVRNLIFVALCPSAELVYVFINNKLTKQGGNA